ncbi:MAG: AgmX/PglI C-terminal domain-containing protein [Bradymonadia bacterium]
MMTRSEGTLPQRNRTNSCRWRALAWALAAYVLLLPGCKNGSVESKKAAAETDMSGWPILARGLHIEVVRKVIRAHRLYYKACYEDERQRNAEAAGQIKVKFVVSPEGSVVDTQVMENKMAGGEFERCILNRVGAMSFPAAPNGGTTTVRYPFIFNGRQ